MASTVYLLLISFLIAITSSRKSGFYLDNGLDQTVIQKFLTKQDRREVEQEILNLLGLPSRPKPMMPVHLAKSAPKFLLDVYQSLDNEDISLTRSEYSVSGDDQRAIDESDVIMSFNSQKKHVDGLRHDGSRWLWFDVSEVPVEDMIMGAELRIYQSQARNNSRHRHNRRGEDSVAPKDGFYTVTVFQVYRDQYNEIGLQYVDSLNTTVHNEGWLVFNLTGPLTTWVAIPDLNLGLYLSLTPHGQPSHEVQPDEIGIVPAKEDDSHQPFMAAFFKSFTSHQPRLTKREVTRKRKKKSHSDSYHQNPLFHPVTHWTSHSCQIQNLYVSFKDLKWQDWIIAPEGYQAFFCSGDCSFPLNAHMNATNHAIVQTLAQVLNPEKVPKPCCAPTKLSAISVLYFVEDSNVILKKYKNMVVKSCGCH